MSLINYLTKIQFDHGAVALLEAELDALGVDRPMVVTDQGVRAAGLLDPVFRANAEGAELIIFDETPPNPTEGAVEAALALYKERECNGLIAVGGGSSIDLAKAVVLLATHEPPLEQIRGDPGRDGQDHRRLRAGDRHSDDGRHRRGGGSGRADHAP